MTGYTVHTGSTVKFSGGWDRIFLGNQPGKKTVDAKSAKVRSPIAAAKKSAVKATTSKASKTTKKKVGAKSVRKGKSA